MICYLVRHGKDDSSFRGGWSSQPLTDEGIRQAERLARQFRSQAGAEIGAIFSSDLPRAIQTAGILSAALSVPVTARPEFRETNNGLLAGMEDRIAREKYPGVYWSALDWEQPYPEGESPCRFFLRISEAWAAFRQELRDTDRNIILVTHGGVIDVIQCIESGRTYTNTAVTFPIDHCGTVAVRL